MIASLEGIISEKDVDNVIIDVAGVGYGVTITAVIIQFYKKAKFLSFIFMNTSASKPMIYLGLHQNIQRYFSSNYLV